MWGSCPVPSPRMRASSLGLARIVIELSTCPGIKSRVFPQPARAGPTGFDPAYSMTAAIVGVDVGGTTTAAEFGLPACVDNDVNALALGEWMFGAGRGARSLVVLAAGTGFGAGVVLEGRLVRGAGGFGGELGHAPVRFDGPRCWCGGRGCLALYASGRGIVDSARARVAGHAQAPLLKAAGGDPMGITAAGVFHAAAEGDSVAASVVDEACQALGAMIGIVVNGLNPEIIIVTGGGAQAPAPPAAKILPPAGEEPLPPRPAAARGPTLA